MKKAYQLAFLLIVDNNFLSIGISNTYIRSKDFLIIHVDITQNGKWLEGITEVSFVLQVKAGRQGHHRKRQVARGHHRGEMCSSGEDIQARSSSQTASRWRANIKVQDQKHQARLSCRSRSPSFLVKATAVALSYIPATIKPVCSTGED